ncbi:hypothetical protein [Phaffia rhodozyma]|uniref:Ca3427-like PBP 2 domain-containing protein n=1 Tax=Phaffia rhodozyma TaxID=264483 RepID=A0A0F7SP54_PHARH|nr:hypothetical protein [Phaffia rhodozyma]
MTSLRIGYVPEHFSTPLLELAKEDGGQTFTLVKCPAGTGEMISRLTANEIDISIALTESLIAGIVNGSKAYKMIGSYVSSPLNWAVITGLDTQFNSIADLRGQKCGVSRIGSGSQVMAQVMADQQGWVDDEGRPEAMDFVVNGSFERLRQSVNDGSTAYFMWEHFTTKPYLSEVRFIGSVPTPWPSWAIAASAPTLASAVSKSQVREILHRLEAKVNEFDSETSRKKKSGDLVEKEFGYPRTDVEAWLQTVSYFSKLEGMDKSMILTTLETLTKAGVVTVPEGGWTIEGEILASLD